MYSFDEIYGLYVSIWTSAAGLSETDLTPKDFAICCVYIKPTADILFLLVNMLEFKDIRHIQS